MAYNLLYPSSTNLIPWEFITQTRSYLIPLLLVPVVFIASHIHFTGILFFQIFRFFLSLITLAFIPLANILFKNDTEEDKISILIVSWFFALYLPLIFFSNYIGADGFGLILMVFLLFYLSKNKTGEYSFNKLFLIGLIIGILISFRLQYGLIFIPILIYFLLKRKFIVIVGILLGGSPLLLIDYLFYGIPGVSIVNFFEYNVVQQKNVTLVNANFWWLYIVIVPLLLLYCGLGLPIIIFNYTINFKKDFQVNIRLLGIGSLIYIIFFQLLTYKEVRFIIPAIVIVFYDSFQSLPAFLSYVKKIRRKSLTRAYVLLMIFSIPISIIVAPYNYDLKDNLWLAQEQVKHLEPQANVGILDPFYLTGGYFLQYGSPTNGKIYFMDGMTINEINTTLRQISYLILDQRHPLYKRVSDLKNSICTTNKLIQNYTNLRFFSIDYLNYQLNSNKLGMYIELWQCN